MFSRFTSLVKTAQKSSGIARNTSAVRPALAIAITRSYADVHKLTPEDVQTRVLNVVKAFEKITPESVTPKAHFQKDLGLDSLDTVELVMQLEDEFTVEIPDAEFEKIQSTEDAINYIVAHPHAK